MNSTVATLRSPIPVTSRAESARIRSSSPGATRSTGEASSSFMLPSTSRLSRSPSPTTVPAASTATVTPTTWPRSTYRSAYHRAPRSRATSASDSCAWASVRRMRTPSPRSRSRA